MEWREVLQTLKWLHVSFLAGDNIRAVFPSYGNMFNSPSSIASPLSFTGWFSVTVKHENISGIQMREND